MLKIQFDLESPWEVVSQDKLKVYILIIKYYLIKGK